MLYSTPWTSLTNSHQNVVKLWDPHAVGRCRLHSTLRGNALCPRYTGSYWASCHFSIRVSVQVLIDLSYELYEGFQKETGDSHVENVRTDGFHIILKQQSPLLEMHEVRNKVRSLLGSCLMQIECKLWMKDVNSVILNAYVGWGFFLYQKRTGTYIFLWNM